MPCLWAVFDTVLLLVVLRCVILTDRQRAIHASVHGMTACTRPKEECSGVESLIAGLNRKLCEFETRERLIFDFAQQVLLMLDAGGCVLAVNETIRRCWGMNAQTVVGHDVLEFVWEESQGDFKKLLQKSRASKESVSALIRIKSPISVHKFVRFHIEWSEANGSYYCCATDHSAQWMVEKIRSEYSGMVTHDLRVPLGSIKLLLESLQSDPSEVLDNNGTARIAAAMASCMHLSNLISKLVTLDRSEAGELSVFKQMVPLDSIIEECVAINRASAEKCSVRLSPALVHDVVVWCEREAIVRVLTNLLANAVQHSPGGQSVEITTRVNMQEVEVAVADRGPGVADIRKQSIFERYKTSDSERGLGLGLAVAKAFVGAHGQRIGVLDRDGGGAIFFFTLEIATEEEVNG